MLCGISVWAQIAKAPAAKSESAQQPFTVEVQIEGSNCFYLNTDFDTGLPLSADSMCIAQAHHKIKKSGVSTIVHLYCNAQFATCARLMYGHTYELELITTPNPDYPECGLAKLSPSQPGKGPQCWTVHARPYDLVYSTHTEFDCEAEQPPGTEAYDVCKKQTAPSPSSKP